MEKIVKYHNDMNNVNFSGFNAVELDLLFSICAKIKAENTNILIYSFDQLRVLSKYKPTANSRFISDLQRVNSKLLSLNFTLSSTTRILQFVLFKDFEIDLETQELSISVNDRFSYILNELTANFTRFELQEFISLESKYSKNLYRILKQYRNTGKVYFSIDNFRNKLDIPSSYKMRDINKTVLTPIQKELMLLFQNFKIEKIKSKKRGNPVIQINFSFTPEKSKKSSQNELLENIRQVYLSDFTLDEVKTLSKYGSLEDLKFVSKQYDDYKMYKKIDHKMGFMIDLINKNNNVSLDVNNNYDDLFSKI